MDYIKAPASGEARALGVEWANCKGENVLGVAAILPLLLEGMVTEVDCVESTADASTCTSCGEELYTLATAAANGGGACTGSSTLCTDGQGSTSCPAPVDCVENTADTSTCTTVGMELYTLMTGAANGGAASYGR